MNTSQRRDDTGIAKELISNFTVRPARIGTFLKTNTGFSQERATMSQENRSLGIFSDGQVVLTRGEEGWSGKKGHDYKYVRFEGGSRLQQKEFILCCKL